ncbi:MAG: hypothetical protein WC321_03140 [Candidatus Omnitrophota bacterium]
MAEGRSLSVSLISLISIIFFAYSFLFFVFFFPSESLPWFEMLRNILCLIVSFLGLVASIFVFDIRRWARKLILYSCFFFLGLGIANDLTNLIKLKWYGVPYLVTLKGVTFSLKKLSLYSFWLILILFLTRPKVKEQFK